tara:strand:+ start:564 stop:1451 length:888 start_codon:yes stop_codon:yes gene_type:complete
MKPKQKIIALILLSCTLIWLSSKAIKKLGTHTLNKQYKITQNISHINISENNKSITLSKKNDTTWEIEKTRIDANKINTLLSSIESLGSKKLISKNKKKHPLYKVTTANKTMLLMNKNQTLLSIIIGKQGPTWDSTYIRLLPENNVYLINKPLATLVSNEKIKWNDLRVYPFSEKTIKKLALTLNNNTVSFEKHNDQWKINTSDKTLSIPSMNTLLTPLSHLVSTDISLVTSNTFEPFITLDLTTINDKTINYALTPLSQESMGIITSEQPNYIFKIQMNQIINLLTIINYLSPL